MAESRLRAAQSLSGVVFAAFLLLHLLNQMSAVLGAPVYDRVQGELRAGYQIPSVEIALVLVPLLVHVILGVAGMVRPVRARPRALTLSGRLHRWSGRFLLAVVAGHVAATRLPAVLSGVQPGFAGIAFTFRWLPLWFWPYYGLLALSGWYHLSYGLVSALPGLVRRRATRWFLGLVFIAGAAALLAAVVSFGTADGSVLQSDTARWWLTRF